MSPPLPLPVDLDREPAYHWDGRALVAVSGFKPLPVELIVGVDRQKEGIAENSRRHALGHAAHDALLWGARGMGKSALVKSVVGDLQRSALPVALIEAAADHVATLPRLFTLLNSRDRRFILFIDDIAFDASDNNARLLRSLLEGGVEARPDNVRVYVTSNRRNIIERKMSDQDDPINIRDSVDDNLALADRFGLKLGFQYPDQNEFLDMVRAYAGHFGLEWLEADAIAFAHGRGGRSGRVAWHYATELAGRAGRKI